MPLPYTTILFWRVQTYTLALVVGIGVTLAWAALRTGKRPGALADVGLGALVGGLALARVEHVILNWNYFAYNLSEAFRLSAGGLDWHGAVVGGLIGGSLMARWRQVNTREVLDAMTQGLSLIAHAAWYGCWAANCAYGVEVDTLARFPAWAVGWNADIYGIAGPRYNTQIFGLWLSAALLVIALVLVWRGWLRGSRFWLILGLFSAGMFVIGFFRGDHAVMVNGLRLDQWLDAMVGAISLTFGSFAQLSAISLRKQKGGENLPSTPPPDPVRGEGE
jgi:phosphatidylglycerol:prolipoprotein diacylglycerol transferase